MINDPAALRAHLIATAVALYTTDDAPLTARRLCEAAGFSQMEFYQVFDHVDDVLPAYYTARLDAFLAIRDAIDAYESFSLDERVSTFIFVFFDLLEADAAFVEQSFSELYATGRLTPFRDALAEHYAALLDHPDIPATNQALTRQAWVHRALAHRHLYLIDFWTRDTSPQREQTTALADKLVAFFADVVTFRGVERGIDLVRYLQQIGEVNVRWIPFVGRYLAGDDDPA